jgi:hypothetical protein
MLILMLYDKQKGFMPFPVFACRSDIFDLPVDRLYAA